MFNYSPGLLLSIVLQFREYGVQGLGSTMLAVHVV